MFSQSLLRALLTPEQRAFGLSVEEDEDALFLMFRKTVAKFSTSGATPDEIRKEADRYINEAKSGIEFVKETKNDI